MWIYYQEQARRRAAMHPMLGLWFDHWLFLHADQTAGFWCGRPFGIASLEALALGQRDSRVQKSLRRALWVEAEQLAIARSRLGSAETVPLDSELASGRWHRWLRGLASMSPRERLMPLVDALLEGIEEQRVPRTLYLSRQLSSSLGDSRGRRTLHQLGGELLGELPGSIAESIEFLGSRFAAWIGEGGTSLFHVRVPVTSTRVPRSFLDSFHPARPVASKQDGRWVLSAVETRVESSHPEEAAIAAMLRFSRFLEHVRLRWYLRPRLAGNLVVDDLGGQREALDIPLPEPFFGRTRAGARAAPKLPTDWANRIDDFHPTSRRRLAASRWHLSQAYGVWSEDVTSAAALVWQALESLVADAAGPALTRVKLLLGPYFRHTVPLSRASALYAAKKQKHYCRRNPGLCQVEESWFGPLSVEKAPWPAAPALLADRRIGLLRTLDSLLSRPLEDGWASWRLGRDLALLNGHRNSIVHTGETALAPRTVEHLARVGAEILVGATNQLFHDAGREPYLSRIERLLQREPRRTDGSSLSAAH